MANLTRFLLFLAVQFLLSLDIGGSLALAEFILFCPVYIILGVLAEFIEEVLLNDEWATLTAAPHDQLDPTSPLSSAPSAP